MFQNKIEDVISFPSHICLQVDIEGIPTINLTVIGKRLNKAVTFQTANIENNTPSSTPPQHAIVLENSENITYPQSRIGWQVGIWKCRGSNAFFLNKGSFFLR